MIFTIQFLLSLPSYAATYDCESVKLLNVTMQGNRDDGFYFQNKLTLLLSEECGGKKYAHADIKNTSLPGFLSIALSAKAMNKPVNISVNTNNSTSLSNQIAYIGISE